MILNKKGVQSHMLIIVIVSTFMTLLILSVLSTIFISDPAACQELNFEVLDSTCKSGNLIDLNLKNLAENKNINLNINDFRNITLDPLKSNRFKIPPSSDGSKIVITPFFESVNGNQWCRGKKKTTKEINMIVKC